MNSYNDTAIRTSMGSSTDGTGREKKAWTSAHKMDSSNYRKMVATGGALAVIATFVRYFWEPIVSFGLTWVLISLHIIRL